jgi:DNA-damage-inducible protein D
MCRLIIKFYKYLALSRIILTFAPRIFYKLKNNIMKTEEIKDLFNKFESIVCDYNGVECWSARELYKLLGYVQWRNFLTIVEKAKIACENAGENINYHFADVSKMIGLGKGGQREVDNILLTRYAPLGKG